MGVSCSCHPNGLCLPDDVGLELFRGLQDPTLVVTDLGQIIEVNCAMLTASGKSRGEVLGHGACEILHGGRWPHIKCPLEEFLTTRSYRVEDSRLPGLGGQFALTVLPISGEVDGQALTLLIARKLTQDEARKVDSIRTSQLAAIGELAAGVAHEVNNPINGIINYAQLLLDESEDGSEQALILKRIVKEGERIAAITYNLLSFARENENERALVDLNEVVQDSISLVEHQLKNDGISINCSLGPQSCLIIGNHLQLMQVLLNLISNSRFALKERANNRQGEEGKRIEISSAFVEIDGASYYQLCVKDNGTGIPQGLQDKLFEPFFTSKPAGQGSGLGLSISYGIIKNHNGSIRVESKLNEYTAMIIDLPASGS